MEPEPSPGRPPRDYPLFLSALKERIRAAQVKAVLAVNREMVSLYWDLGRDVVERVRRGRWGTGIIERISRDIRAEFPGIKGFSTQNIWRMRAFYRAWTEDIPILAQPARELGAPNPPAIIAEIPWYHNVILFEKLKNPSERLWYARQTLQHGWSRPVLVHQIESGLHLRQGKALTNFTRTLPSPQSDLAQEALKDEYAFDFLASTDIRERVIELKAGPFKPEHAGKMNFYLSAADDLLRRAGDDPSIGIILCRSKNKIVAEYALRDSGKPIGVSSYRATRALPEGLKDALPHIPELEAGLARMTKAPSL